MDGTSFTEGELSESTWTVPLSRDMDGARLSTVGHLDGVCGDNAPPQRAPTLRLDKQGMDGALLGSCLSLVLAAAGGICLDVVRGASFRGGEAHDPRGACTTKLNRAGAPIQQLALR